MSLARRALSSWLVMAVVMPGLLQETASACTSLALVAKDGALVYGRTMERGAFDLDSHVAIVSRGHQFGCHTPDGKPDMAWKARYGIVGLDAIEKDVITNGMSEEGLVVGVLYLPRFAEYQPCDPATADISRSSAELANLILGEFAIVDEVREGPTRIRVVSVVEPALGGLPPLHWTVMDPSGKAIVVQYLKG